jgi:type IX secretion system PorP/SprF family membrane protein
MKKNIIVIGLLIISFNAFTQQLQTSSLYDLQGIFHNASTAGVSATNYVGATYRTQWSGISGRPKTATIFGSFELPNQKMGVGAYIYSDKTGPTSRTGIQIAIAKHIPLADGAKLSFGIENRLQQFAIDKNKLQQTLGNDPVLGASENNFKYDAGFGVSYTGKKLQIGLAVSQLIQSKLDFYSGNLTRNESARLYRHYYAHAQYKWVVDERITITPNMLFIYLPNAPLEFQGGVRVEHKNFLWWGLSARARQSFMLSAGLNINKNLSVGYSFDIYRTPLSIFEGGSNGHEFLLRYNFVR